MVVDWVHSHLRVDDEEQKIGLTDGPVDLAADLEVHWCPLVVVDAPRIDEPERVPRPLRLGKVPVPRRSRLFRNDGGVLPDDSIEQLGLADVRTADDCHDRNVHTFTPPQSTPSQPRVPSFSKT